MIRITEKMFLNEMRDLINSNKTIEYLSERALDMMNSSINWSPECRDLALDIIYAIEPQFEISYGEILDMIDNLEKVKF